MKLKNNNNMARFVAITVVCLFTLTLIRVQPGGSVSLSAVGDEKQVKWLKYDDSDQNSESNEATCYICQKDFTRFLGFELSCGHKFHEFCLRDWQNEYYQLLNRGCPVCGAEMDTMKGGQRVDKFFEARERALAEQERELWGVLHSIPVVLIKD